MFCSETHYLKALILEKYIRKKNWRSILCIYNYINQDYMPYIKYVKQR